ncbi:MAG: hypothetical protein JXR53_01145 [Bacteroidales bacterium]|nr:hypothetical protein [Bacteroidales bacterium]
MKKLGLLLSTLIVVFIFGCGGGEKIKTKETQITVSNLEMPETMVKYLEPIEKTYPLVYDEEYNLIITSIDFKVLKKIPESKMFTSISLDFVDNSNSIIETDGRVFKNQYSLKPIQKAKVDEVVTIDFAFSPEKVVGEGIDYEIVNLLMENTTNFSIKDAELKKNEDYKRKIYALDGKNIHGTYGNCFELVDTVMEEGFINLESHKLGDDMLYYVTTDYIRVAAVKPNQTNRCFMYIDFYDKDKNKIKELVSLEDGGSVYSILEAGEGTEDVEFCSPNNSHAYNPYKENMDKIYYFQIRADN